MAYDRHNKRRGRRIQTHGMMSIEIFETWLKER